jgi:hypothetical protein
MTDPIPSRTDPVYPLPEYFGRGHRPRKLAAAAWFGLAFLLLAMAATTPLLSLWWVGMDQLIHSSKEFTLGYWGGLILGCGLLLPLASVKCFVHAKRLRSPSAVEIFASEHRPPVVYFRPFTADLKAKPRGFSSTTEEEAIAYALNDIGPLIAIGTPEETLPSLGAARMYVDNEKWREAALDLLGRAAVVVMRIGSTPGFWWEFETVMHRVKPEKLVLLIPRDQALYEEFRLASHKLMQTPLPALTGLDRSWIARKWPTINLLKAVILFDSKWAASVIDVQTLRLPFLQRGGRKGMAPVLRMAVRPIYQNAGLRWTGPPINRETVFTLGFAVVSSVVTLVSIVVWLRYR